MNIKNLLIGILSLLTFETYAQSEKSDDKIAGTKTPVTEFKVEAKNLDELKNFGWSMVKEMFKENDLDQEITLSFAYKNDSQNDESVVRVDNFEFKISGKTSDLDKLTARLEKSFTKLAEIDGMDKD